LLYEMAGLLNSRPLSYVSSDQKDFRSITPNDLLEKDLTMKLHNISQRKNYLKIDSRAFNG